MRSKLLPLLCVLLCALPSACPSLNPGDGGDSIQADLEKVDAILTIVGNELVAEIADKDPVKAARIGKYLDTANTLIDTALQGYLENGQLDLADAKPALLVLRDAVLDYLQDAEMSEADRVKWTRRVNSAETLVRLLID